MAKYGSDDFIISADANNMSNFVDTLNGFDIEALLQESHAFGDSWVEQFFTGVQRGNEFTVGGFYDDTVTVGPDAIFKAIGTTLAMILTWGGSKTSTFSALVRLYRRIPTRGELTRFEVTLVPTGTVTEA